MNEISVDKWKVKGVYLSRAEQYLRSMNIAFENKDWDSCVGNGIHAIISAQDALTIHIKGKRYKGTDHGEAAALFKTLIHSDEHKKAFQRLTGAISIKTDAEYGDRSSTEKEAQRVIKDAERFLAYVKSIIV